VFAIDPFSKIAIDRGEDPGRVPGCAISLDEGAKDVNPGRREAGEL